MPVTRSPFSNPTPPVGGGKPKNIFELATPDAANGARLLAQDAAAGLGDVGIKTGGGTDTGGTKTTLSTEQRKLDSSYSTALAKIATGNMTESEKNKARKVVNDIYKKGQSDTSFAGGLFGGLTKIAGGVVGAPFKALEEVGKVTGFASRAIQSTIKETVDLGAQMFDAADTTRNQNGPKFSWGELVSQTKDKNFKLVNTGNKWVDGIVDFAADVAFDPTTYLGVGALNYVGKAGRTELMIKFSTEAMRAKYPQMIGKLDDIARYGLAAIPKEVRVAENLGFGVRYMGKVVPHTEALAQIVSGKYGVGTLARNVVGDNIARAARVANTTGLISKAAGSFVPSSRAGLVALGVGRKLGVEDSKIIHQIADYTSARYAKGFKTEFYNKNIRGISDTVKAIQAAGKSKEIARLVEDRALLAATPDAQLRDWAKAVIDWQDSVRNQVNAVRSKFNADYAGAMNDIGFIDEYVHHRITDDALRMIFGKDSKYAGLFKPEDLMPQELGASTGAAMYRTVRKPKVLPDGTTEWSEFMGEKTLGTIEDVNRIFKAKTGTDINFFEDDISAIVDSYAYSMSAARGREAYVRRLMDFGGDVVRVINKKTIPDQGLVNSLTKVHRDMLGVRAMLIRKVNRGRAAAAATAEDAVAFAKRVLDQKDAEAARLTGKIDDVQSAITRIERDLADAFTAANYAAIGQRGVFFEAHAALLDEIGTLKNAIAQGRISEVVAHDALRSIYTKMHPDAKRIPGSASRLLDAVNRNLGISDSAEIKTLQKQLKVLQKQLRETPAANAQEINDLLDIEQTLLKHIDGYTALTDVKMAADYADDGLLYGISNDLVPRPFDPNNDPMARVISTRPMVAGDANMTTDEIAAMRNAMLTDPQTVAVHAVDAKDVIDMRAAEHFYDFWDPQNGVGDAVGFALRQAGVDPEDVFKTVWDDVLNGVPVDPMFEQVYPELSSLMTMVGSVHAHVFDLGVVDDQFHVDVFETLTDLFTQVAASASLENADVVGKQMTQDFLRAMVEEGIGNTGKPVLLPSRVLFGADNPMAEDAYSLILPDAYSYAKNHGVDIMTPDALDATTSPVQFTKDNPFISSITNDDYHTASLQAQQVLDVVGAAGQNLQKQFADRAAVQEQIKAVGGKIGGAKGQGSRRMKQAQKAYDEYAASGMVEITLAGKPVKVTRDKALELLNTREAKINAKIARLNQRIDSMIGGKVQPFETQLKKQQERLATLFNQREVIRRWSAETGDALRAEIDGVRAAIATDTPAGWLGTNSRMWSERVNARLNAIDGLEDSPVKDAWTRVVHQLHGDEAQLAKLEMNLVNNAETISQVQMGNLFPRIIDDIEQGWEVLGGLGIQVPPEMAAIMKPNIKRLRDRAEWGPIRQAVNRYHQIFKVYATMTPGFITRNAMSSTFMNLVAGVDHQAIMDGTSAMVAYKKYGAERIVNGKAEGWLTRLKITDQATRDTYEQALRAMHATGRGMQSDFAHPVMTGGWADKISKNRVTDMFANGNEFVENAARFPMALHSLRRGDSYDEAIYRITRYHFDYTDLSKFDETMKNFIPFWIWTTRNIPLQWTEMLLRPSTYMTYNKIRERNPVAEDVVMPTWLAEKSPIGLGGNWVLNPDLPNIRLADQAGQFANPRRLAGQMFPEMKLPLEMWANKQLAMDIPFSDKFDEAKGVDKLVAALGALTGTDAIGYKDKDGKLVVNPKVSYVMNNLMPLLGTAERVSGGALGGKPTYQERQTSSLLSFFGVPAREVGPREQRSATINKQFTIADVLKELAKKGKIETNGR